ncbi:MAG: TonB-dependent receptor [Pseudomonadota bacterium]
MNYLRHRLFQPTDIYKAFCTAGLISIAVATSCQAHVLAEVAELADAGTASAAKPDKGRADTVKKAEPAKAQTVEVRAAKETYDARREDTATKIVVTQEEIAKYGDTELTDVLKRQPGITVSSGGGISMRGLGYGYTQILLNGEKAPPGFSLETLSPDMVERIEIIRAATAEFSTQAIAGTVNIVLKKAVKIAQRELKLGIAKGHGYTAPNASLQVSDKEDGFSYSVNGYVSHSKFGVAGQEQLTGTDAQGQTTLSRHTTRDSAGTFDGIGFSPRLNFTLANGDTLASQTFINADRQYRSQAGRYELLPGDTAPYASDNIQNQSENTWLRSDLNWVHKLKDDAKLDLKAGVNASRRDTDFRQQGYALGGVNTLDSDIVSYAKETGFTLTGKFSTPYFTDHALSVGWDGGSNRRDEARIQRQQDLPGFPGSNRDEVFKATLSRLALYAQDEWNVTPRWSVYLGARWEGLDTRSEGNLFNAIHNRSSVFSPLFQTLWKLPDSKSDQVRFALTRTYKAPSIGSLVPRRYTSVNNSAVNPDSQGNPNLRPELATGIDAAYEHYWGEGAMFSASVYARQISDLIRNRVAQVDGTWLSTPINDGRARTRGIEMDSKFPLRSMLDGAPAIDVRANLTRNWSTVEDVPGPNNRLAQQTPFSATVGLDYHTAGNKLTTGGSYSFKSGGPIRISENQQVYTVPRRELDFYGLYKFTPKTQLRLTLANILRQDYFNESDYFDQNGRLNETTVWPSSMHVRLNLEIKL